MSFSSFEMENLFCPFGIICEGNVFRMSVQAATLKEVDIETSFWYDLDTVMVQMWSNGDHHNFHQRSLKIGRLSLLETATEWNSEIFHVIWDIFFCFCFLRKDPFFLLNE